MDKTTYEIGFFLFFYLTLVAQIFRRKFRIGNEMASAKSSTEKILEYVLKNYMSTIEDY